MHTSSRGINLYILCFYVNHLPYITKISLNAFLIIITEEGVHVIE